MDHGVSKTAIKIFHSNFNHQGWKWRMKTKNMKLKIENLLFIYKLSSICIPFMSSMSSIYLQRITASSTAAGMDFSSTTSYVGFQIRLSLYAFSTHYFSWIPTTRSHRNSSTENKDANGGKLLEIHRSSQRTWSSAVTVRAMWSGAPSCINTVVCKHFCFCNYIMTYSWRRSQ